MQAPRPFRLGYRVTGNLETPKIHIYAAHPGPEAAIPGYCRSATLPTAPGFCQIILLPISLAAEPSHPDLCLACAKRWRGGLPPCPTPPRPEQ